MRFFDRGPSDVLLVDAAGETVTAGDVADLGAQLAESVQAHLAFLLADQSLRSLTRFLALLDAGIPVLLLDPRTSPHTVANLVARYSPELVMVPDESSPILSGLPEDGLQPGGMWVAGQPGEPCHTELAVLLSTSGSTGSPKLVRLSGSNVLSNAHAIAKSLNLRAEDRVVTSLPLFYSFGMSLVTSHIAAGSSVLVTGRSVLERDFWKELDEHRVTHLAGVPHTFAMLKRMQFAQKHLPHLRGLLQAGGRLSTELIAEFHEDASEKGRQFFVMYGQTEAGPRMACLPPSRLPEKLGSAGLALEGGGFAVHDDSGAQLATGQVGQIVYSGRNVMLGYGHARDDLSRGDETGGVLHTGDLGYIDDEGFLFLTGRSSRIAKVAGVRVSLDEVEGLLESVAPVAAVASPDDGITVFTTVVDREHVDRSRKQLARSLGASYRLLRFRQLPDLPLLPSGKIDYTALMELGDMDD